MEKIDLKNYTLEELEGFLESLGEKKFRGKQIFQWIHKGTITIEEMTNLSKELREKMQQKAYIGNLKTESVLISKVDGTRKYLFVLEDGNIIESVLMRYEHGNTVCVSCQVGCRMGCTFCASTLEGVVRNLTAGEILDQIIAIQRDIGDRVSNVVLMGSGEPLDNYEEVLKFLALVNHPEGLNIGLRSITISTCGLVPKMMDLADRKIQVTLAISLHAPNDILRNTMMPVNRKYPIEELLKACKYYVGQTGRRITFEYAMIRDVNDSEKHASELAGRIRGLLCHVNLIPLNKVDEREYESAQLDRVRKFQSILKKHGVEATIRRELGSDINAACGQLRRRYMKEQSNRQG
ncbi:23S rRNA (adenine2503-C2)-methyltransferase [Anaerosolibacter carboniphilus]|uniref:Probable dual-specificity RNA methyltransferase RlmN n=1 Tax=Anaerosolibacter carboniphilus TaxID=1417629 RepID=A0A841L5Z2_9FIRM|nr:23S rRNA (adenine(2503)-C(2))-methyltransferase RlmN [Anaerosolibacter carboniphilus]MBB6217725.1 23S rRNA (adenine2503-C2)-methyltransferase [Anaerosolibacter carboniphilus]